MPTNKLHGGASGMNASGNVLSAKLSRQSDGKRLEPYVFDDLGWGLIMVGPILAWSCAKESRTKRAEYAQKQAMNQHHGSPAHIRAAS